MILKADCKKKKIQVALRGIWTINNSIICVKMKPCIINIKIQTICMLNN